MSLVGYPLKNPQKSTLHPSEHDSIRQSEALFRKHIGIHCFSGNPLRMKDPSLCPILKKGLLSVKVNKKCHKIKYNTINRMGQELILKGVQLGFYFYFQGVTRTRDSGKKDSS